MAGVEDVVVVGSGPNGLAAAIVLARAGLRTLVLEAKRTLGGGMRTEPLTLPGFMHDVCSAVHPLGAVSPFFRTLGLEHYGVQWVHSEAPLAHVLEEDVVITLERTVEETALQLGADGPAYLRLMNPYVQRSEQLMRMILGPLKLPRHPLLLARFGMTGLSPMQSLARTFKDVRTGALLGGCAAHAMLPLEAHATAAFGMVLAVAGHSVGWPLARGGSVSITRALVACLEAAGGRLEVNHPVADFSDIPKARAYLLDVTPRQLIGIFKHRLPERYRRRLSGFRHGPGVFKMDWALAGPVPWENAQCRRAATIHLSGSLDDMARSERAVRQGRVSKRPFILVVQPSLVDDSRAPRGHHVLWAYCHVPARDTSDLTEIIEGQIERFAPGFRRLILKRVAYNSEQMEAYNQNYVGGDINGGSAELRQLFFRPIVQVDPYRTSFHNVFLCSSSTPPGGGVHGMCGYYAAQSALRNVFDV